MAKTKQATTTVNRTTGKRIDKPEIEILDGMSEKEIQQAMAFWQKFSDAKANKLNRQEWCNLGKVCFDAKQALNNNTKKFGAWRDKHFPGINAPTVSQAQMFYKHFTAIDTWASKNRPGLSHPMELVRLYQKEHNVKLKIDGTSEAVEPKTDDSGNASQPEAGKNDRGIEGLIDDYRKAVNAIIKAKDNLHTVHFAPIAEIHYSMSELLKSNADKVKEAKAA